MKMIGVDVGGTFTNSVFYDDATGELRWAKAPSSPANPSDGVIASLKRIRYLCQRSTGSFMG